MLTRPLDNLKTRKAMNAKFLGYFIYVEMVIYLLLHNCMISLLIKWSFLLAQNSHLVVTRYWHNLSVCHEEALSNILHIIDINEGLSTNLAVHQVNGKNEWEVCKKTVVFESSYNQFISNKGSSNQGRPINYSTTLGMQVPKSYVK